MMNYGCHIPVWQKNSDPHPHPRHRLPAKIIKANYTFTDPSTEMDGLHFLPSDVMQRMYKGHHNHLQQTSLFLLPLLPHDSTVDFRGTAEFNCIFLLSFPFALTFQEGMLSTGCNGPLQFYHQLHIPERGEVLFYFCKGHLDLQSHSQVINFLPRERPQ